MAQELTVQIPLSSSLAGEAANLRAQLYDDSGATVGGLVSTGFTDLTLGHYQWHYAAFPDGFEGSVVFTISGVAKASVALNNADFGVVATASATSIATAVWASGTRTLTSFGTLVADVAAAVWAYATRTLTMSAAAIAAAVSGTSITLRRGDTNTVSLTGLGDISTRTKLWFTVKESEHDADSASILQIVEGTGLVYLNGAAATAGQGSLVVTNAVTGAVTITLAAAAAAVLEVQGRLRWDIQESVSGTITTLAEGPLAVARDITRSIT